MFFLPRSVRFALFALLSNPWIGISMSACLTYSFGLIPPSSVINRSSQTEATLQRLWYVYTAASHELYKKECGTILYEDHHVVGCLHFLFSSVFSDRHYLCTDLSDLVVLYTKEDSTTVQTVKFLLENKYPTFSIGSVLPRAYYKKNGASPKGKYSIYGCLDWMFASKPRWWRWFARSDKKSSKKFLEELIEKNDSLFNFFYADLLDLERSIFSILAKPDVRHCFLKNPLFKKDIGFCMPFYIDFLRGKERLQVAKKKRIHEKSSFIDEIVSSTPFNLAHQNKALIKSMKQHSLFK